MIDYHFLFLHMLKFHDYRNQTAAMDKSKRRIQFDTVTATPGRDHQSIESLSEGNDAVDNNIVDDNALADPAASTSNSRKNDDLPLIATAHHSQESIASIALLRQRNAIYSKRKYYKNKTYFEELRNAKDDLMAYNQKLRHEHAYLQALLQLSQQKVALRLPRRGTVNDESPPQHLHNALLQHQVRHAALSASPALTSAVSLSLINNGDATANALLQQALLEQRRRHHELSMLLQQPLPQSTASAWNLNHTAVRSLLMDTLHPTTSTTLFRSDAGRSLSSAVSSNITNLFPTRSISSNVLEQEQVQQLLRSRLASIHAMSAPNPLLPSVNGNNDLYGLLSQNPIHHNTYSNGNNDLLTSDFRGGQNASLPFSNPYDTVPNPVSATAAASAVAAAAAAADLGVARSTQSQAAPDRLLELYLSQQQIPTRTGTSSVINTSSTTATSESSSINDNLLAQFLRLLEEQQQQQQQQQNRRR
jgi:hypothetical protein